MSTWLFIGSGPSSPAGLAMARRERIIERIITTNSGIVLEPRPDYFFCWDAEAAKRFEAEAASARAAGTRLLTLDVPEWSRKANRVQWYDEFLPVGNDDPTRERWGRFRGSGTCCMEYAIRQGATAVLLAGCDGYRYDSPEDYFDRADNVGRIYGRRMAESATVNDLQPRTQELVRLWPEIAFIAYGAPIYQVEGTNWQVIPIPA